VNKYVSGHVAFLPGWFGSRSDPGCRRHYNGGGLNIGRIIVENASVVNAIWSESAGAIAFRAKFLTGGGNSTRRKPFVPGMHR
jgi:hypothetical protein